MKFLTLLKKELQESGVLMILVAIFFMVLASLMIRDFVLRGGDDYQYYVQNNDENIQLFHRSPFINETGPLLIFLSIVLGLKLGIIHFGMPSYAKTWAFLTHRSVSRITILCSKLLCAALAFGIGLGIPWIWANAYFNHVKTTGFPLNPRMIWEGWLFIGLGFAIYLGTALSVLNDARWYTTRLFNIVLVFLVMNWLMTLSSLPAAWALLTLTLLLLLVQLIVTFSRKSF